MKWRVGLFFLWLCVGFTRSVWAKTPLYSTDFSSIDDWETRANFQHAQPKNPCFIGDQPARWSTVESLFGHGSLYGIDIVNSPPCSTATIPTSVSPHLLAYEVQLRMFVSHPEQDRNLLLRWQDSDTYLGFHIFHNMIWAEKIVAGVPQALTKTSHYFPLKMNTWYDITMQYDRSRGRIRLSVNDRFIFETFESLQDPWVEQGTPGLAASVGGVSSSNVWFDSFQVFSLESSNQLSVTPFRQNDPRWSKNVYDSAEDWSQTPTIERWGCALTSAVMALRFHGIDHVPGGETLTPDTLNTWLKKEPDGYWWEGHVNWRALTRLARWHHQAYGTTELEFLYQARPETPLSWIREQVNQQRLPILDHGNHFTLAYGYGPGEADILIHDPLFSSRPTLHAYDLSFQSARIFIPSQTDLSALTLLVPASTTLHFTADHQPLDLSPIPLFQLDPTAVTPRLIGWLYDLPKPSLLGEKIRFEISKPTIVLAWSYDKSGTVQKNVFWMTPEVSGEYSGADQVFHAPSVTLPPFTKGELSWWLYDDGIRHPLLVEQLLRWQEQLPEQATEALEALRRWQKLGWIHSLVAQQIEARWVLLLGLSVP